MTKFLIPINTYGNQQARHLLHNYIIRLVSVAKILQFSLLYNWLHLTSRC